MLILVSIPILAIGPDAHGAKLTMSYTDQLGDANGSNGQGAERGVELGVSTEPLSVAEADILRVAFRPVYGGGNVTGFSITFTLAGDVSDEYMYGVKAYVTLRCGITLTYRPPITEAFGHCRDDTVRLPDGMVRRSQLTIVVPLDLLPKGIHPGDTLTTIDAYSVPRLDLAGTPLHGPKLDYASTSKTYVIPGA